MPYIYENLSVGYENLNFGAHFTQQIQLSSSAALKISSDFGQFEALNSIEYRGSP